MELPQSLVAEILAVLEQPRPVTATGAEHRRKPRYDQAATVLVTPWPATTTLNGDAFSATIRNCSAYGIAILHNRSMGKGEQFIVRLLSQGRQTTAILCAVAHCRRINPQSFVIGAEFARLLPQDVEIQALSA